MDRFRPWLTQTGVTSAMFATPVLELLLRKDVEKLTTLRWLGFGGARVNPHRITLRDATFDAYNIYGATEMFFAAYARIPKGTVSISPTVGKPISNCKIYIVDEDGDRVVTNGISGEIYSAGKGVMWGMSRPGRAYQGGPLA